MGEHRRTPYGLADVHLLWIAGIGASFIYTGGIAASLKWFPKKRGTASGIMACGFGSGAALFGWLITILVKNYGCKTAFLYTGVGFAVILLLVAQVLRFPETTGRQGGRSG